MTETDESMKVKRPPTANWLLLSVWNCSKLSLLLSRCTNGNDNDTEDDGNPMAMLLVGAFSS